MGLGIGIFLIVVGLILVTGVINIDTSVIDMTTFNQEVWQSVKGTAVPMPAPHHNVIKAGAAGNAALSRQADGDK